MTSHHGEGRGRTPEECEAMKRFMDQIDGKAKREYPAGRMGHEDDGALALAVTIDPTHKTVVLRFGKQVEWIGMGPREAVQLAKMLVDHAKRVSDGPLVITF